MPSSSRVAINIANPLLRLGVRAERGSNQRPLKDQLSRITYSTKHPETEYVPDSRGSFPATRRTDKDIHKISLSVRDVNQLLST